MTRTRQCLLGVVLLSSGVLVGCGIKEQIDALDKQIQKLNVTIKSTQADADRRVKEITQEADRRIAAAQGKAADLENEMTQEIERVRMEAQQRITVLEAQAEELQQKLDAKRKGVQRLVK